MTSDKPVAAMSRDELEQIKMFARQVRESGQQVGHSIKCIDKLLAEVERLREEDKHWREGIQKIKDVFSSDMEKMSDSLDRLEHAFFGDSKQ